MMMKMYFCILKCALKNVFIADQLPKLVADQRVNMEDVHSVFFMNEQL